MTFQELADEALLDVLRKYGRPTTPATPSSAARGWHKPMKTRRKTGPKSKRPAKGRARS